MVASSHTAQDGEYLFLDSAVCRIDDNTRKCAQTLLLLSSSSLYSTALKRPVRWVVERNLSLPQRQIRTLQTRL
jgi:hypothetical protein